MLIRTIHNLHKVFGDDSQTPQEWQSDVAARGEVYSFQILMAPESDTDFGLYQMVSDCGLPCTVRSVEPVPVRYVGRDLSSHALRRGPGLFPDLLLPVRDGELLRVVFQQKRTFYVTVDIPEDARPGKYKFSFTFRKCYYQNLVEDKVLGTAEFELEVLDTQLPPAEIKYMRWMHYDCLSSYYQVPCWSEEHWQIVEKFARSAYRHGVNVMYTPLWTPPLDTILGGERPTCQLLDISYDPDNKEYTFGFDKLERFIKLGRKIGMKKFAMSHFFTQWGSKSTPKIVVNIKGEMVKKFGWHVDATAPEYGEFIRQLLAKLLPFLRANGCGDDCYFSVSDEPYPETLPDYEAAVNMVRPYLEGMPTLEALSNFETYQRKLVTIPIPAINHYEPFAGQTPEAWAYYCCSQTGDHTNSFINLPLIQTRILGVLSYVYELKGFLHWAYNFYHSQFSLCTIDPFANTDSDGGFPAGDAFVVYPGPDGEVYDSIRNEAIRDGWQDLRLLNAVEKRIGREKVLELIGRDLKFNQYPFDINWLIDLRSKLYKALQGEN